MLNSNNNLKPFLKWAGGKSKLSSLIVPHLPKGKRLIEPFLGSGAIFLQTSYPQYWLVDINKDLINVYQFLQKEGVTFIQDCKKYFHSKTNNKEYYLKIREKFNKSQEARQRAIFFVYLNRHGYNGLCRYNSKNIFNVPFGRYKKINLLEERMLAFYQRTKNCIFKAADYREVFKQAENGDVIYCDPPYVPLSKTAYFTSYYGQKFDEHNQIELAHLAKEATQKGAIVIISNHDTVLTRKLYKGAKLIKFPVHRGISCQVDTRKPAKELIAIFSGNSTCC